LTSSGQGDGAFDRFLDLVESTYDEFERDRRLLDHSTRLASDELAESMASLSANERLFRSLARCSPNGIIYTDDVGQCLYANRRAEELFGSDADQLSGFGWVPHIPDQDMEFFGNISRDTLSNEDSDYVIEHRLRRPDGSVIWVSTSVAVVDHSTADRSNAVGWVANIEDITQRKLHEQELSRLARNDSLTGLENRYSMTHRLQTMCTSLSATNRLAVAVIDLDRFKLVNDTFGHETGDNLLVAMASKLTAAVGDRDVVARLGGDEFAVATLLDPDDDPERFAARLSRAIHGPVDCGGRVVHVAGSVGVAVSRRHLPSPDELLRDADTAMYRAKRSRTLTFQVFNETFRAEVTSRFALESELRSAITDRQIYLAYQPIADAVTNEVVVVEALARWNNKRLGMVPPTEFISAAEDLGLINDLGDQLLNLACEQLRRWRTRGLRQLVLSFNTSPLQLADPEFPNTVRRVLARNALPPDALLIEITEHAIVTDFERSIGVLDELRAMGVAIAIDDFGTGYSSLSYLERLPVDYLKIDKSFVQAMGDQPKHESANRLTQTIIELAHRFGLTPVAEGVETDAHQLLLRRAGCDLVQGYLLATPMAPDDRRLDQILDSARSVEHDPERTRLHRSPQ
jgi:diguanylate cyclase (GGDEF)-like protein/PAS domain S-box-containing protein